MCEMEREISYERMAEIATKCIHALYESDEESANEFLREELDIDESESEWFGIKRKLFPALYKVVELTFKRIQIAKVKVAVPMDAAPCDYDDYVVCQYNLEPEYGDEYDWEYDDYDGVDYGLNEDEIRDMFGDELWNWDTFAD